MFETHLMMPYSDEITKTMSLYHIEVLPCLHADLEGSVLIPDPNSFIQQLELARIALRSHGWVHSDIKPANIMYTHIVSEQLLRRVYMLIDIDSISASTTDCMTVTRRLRLISEWSSTLYQNETVEDLQNSLRQAMQCDDLAFLLSIVRVLAPLKTFIDTTEYNQVIGRGVKAWTESWDSLAMEALTIEQLHLLMKYLLIGIVDIAKEMTNSSDLIQWGLRVHKHNVYKLNILSKDQYSEV
jgi:serine/threonine protein kinase